MNRYMVSSFLVGMAVFSVLIEIQTEKDFGQTPIILALLGAISIVINLILDFRGYWGAEWQNE